MQWDCWLNFFSHQLMQPPRLSKVTKDWSQDFNVHGIDHIYSCGRQFAMQYMHRYNPQGYVLGEEKALGICAFLWHSSNTIGDRIFSTGSTHLMRVHTVEWIQFFSEIYLASANLKQKLLQRIWCLQCFVNDIPNLKWMTRAQFQGLCFYKCLNRSCMRNVYIMPAT